MKKIKLIAITILVLLISQNSFADTNYVSLSGGHISPFTSWTTAATNIQNAVDVATDGDVVLVTNGIYNSGEKVTPGYSCKNRLVITENITVESVTGPENTIIFGNGPNGAEAIRCVYMSTGILSGFTISNGHTLTTGTDSYDKNGGGVNMYNGNGIVTNCIIIGNSANAGGGTHYGTVSRCIITGNSSGWGGGTRYGMINNCIIKNNSANYGGGIHSGIVNNSIIENNSANTSGGGIYGAAIYNCLIDNNSAGYGGGISDGIVNNSTITDNIATDTAGGTLNGTIYNSIIWDNSAPNSDDYYNGIIRYSCSFPLPTGEGNISNNPQFVSSSSDYHLFASSSCVNAGTNAYAPMPFDLDNNPRIYFSTVDMGCYEFNTLPFIKITNTPTEIAYDISIAEISVTNQNIDGEMWWINSLTGSSGTVQISTFHFQVSIDHGDNLITVSGTNNLGYSTNDSIIIHRETYDEAAPLIVITNTTFTVPYSQTTTEIGGTNNANVVGQLWWVNNLTGESARFTKGEPWFKTTVNVVHGKNLITVYGTNAYGHSISNSVIIHRRTPTHYVDVNGANPTYPYISWATAAIEIQTAINVAESNDIVFVADGVYNSGGALTPHYGSSNRVMINKPIEVRSVNGPEVTTILGSGPIGSYAVRCAYLTNNAFLSGFTLKNGYADSWSGGGAYIDQCGVISNCVIENCEEKGIYMRYNGMYIYPDDINLLLVDSVITGNKYGGIYIAGNGRVEKCTINNNFSSYQYGKGAGVYISQNGLVENCLISGNQLTGDRSEGGGIYFAQEPTFTGSAVVRFSTITGNSAVREAGGIRVTGNEYDWVLVDNCVISSNSVNESGGGVSFWYGGRVNDCSVFGNNATWGGGFYFFADGSHPIQHGEARNCTIVNNYASLHGGGINNNGPSVVYNSIIYFNDAPDATNYDSYTTFQYCCSDPQPIGPGNIIDYPLFQDIYSADFHLLKMSPCINTGSNSLTNGIEKLDLDGLSRILGGTVNMGCYEQNRDPDIPPPSVNTLKYFAEENFNRLYSTETNIIINGTKTAGELVVTKNIFGGWVTNGIAQTLDGLTWTSSIYIPIESSNTFFYKQADVNQIYVSTGFVSQTVVIVPEPIKIWIVGFLGFWIVVKRQTRVRCIPVKNAI